MPSAAADWRTARPSRFPLTRATLEASPCLWVAVSGRRHPRWPRHTHHDSAVLLTWELKDILPAKRLVYYGKLLKGRPTLVWLELFPAFVALIDPSPFLMHGIASQERIMARLFDVSLPEVERALGVLAAQGLITRGVARPPPLPSAFSPKP